MTSAGKHLRQATSGRINTDGVVELALTPSSEDWLITVTRISCTQTAVTDPTPTCTTYRDGVAPANAIEGTYSGYSDSSDTRIFLAGGQTIIARWEGGTAGETAVLCVEGVAYSAGSGIAAYAGSGG